MSCLMPSLLSLCAGPCKDQGAVLGKLHETHLPSWIPADSRVHQTALPAVHYLSRHLSLFLCLLHMCSKASHQLPTGLLCPLQVPCQPWSHIAVVFVTGLPLSKGKNTILTIVERFSKALHFVLLIKLPSALETANLLVTHVFRLHGIPSDIVSDITGLASILSGV